MFVTESSVRIIAGKLINKVNKQNLFYLFIIMITTDFFFFFYIRLGESLTVKQLLVSHQTQTSFSPNFKLFILYWGTAS